MHQQFGHRSRDIFGGQYSNNRQRSATESIDIPRNKERRKTIVPIDRLSIVQHIQSDVSTRGQVQKVFQQYYQISFQ